MQQQAADERLLKQLQLVHMAEEHHTRVFSQHSLRAWVEATAISKEDAAAQARKEQTWNKVQGWLAESNLSSGTGAQHHAGVTRPQVSICTISCSACNMTLHHRMPFTIGKLWLLVVL